MSSHLINPWNDPLWQKQAITDSTDNLIAAGIKPLAPYRVVRASGRAFLLSVETDQGVIWIKYSYNLPPGEQIVLSQLHTRWPDHLPDIVAVWSGAVATRHVEGLEMPESSSLKDWIRVARLLAELEAGETPFVDEWIALGVRDRRPALWENDVRLLLESAVVRRMEVEQYKTLELLIPEFISRYHDAFTGSATLIHQDAGCCNIFLTGSGPVFMDWADVVIGHPVFSCDRLLDQVPAAFHNEVIEAFIEPLKLSRASFNAIRKSNVLHEVLRYHDELAYIDPENETYKKLARAAVSQLTVLVKHEMGK